MHGPTICGCYDTSSRSGGNKQLKLCTVLMRLASLAIWAVKCIIIEPAVLSGLFSYLCDSSSYVTVLAPLNSEVFILPVHHPPFSYFSCVVCSVLQSTLFDGLLFFYIHLNKYLITFLHTLLTATFLIIAQCRACSSADKCCATIVFFSILDACLLFSQVVLLHNCWQVMETIAVFEVMEINFPISIILLFGLHHSPGAGLPVGGVKHVLLPVQSEAVTQTLVSLYCNSWEDKWFQWASTVSVLSRWTDVVRHNHFPILLWLLIFCSGQSSYVKMD